MERKKTPDMKELLTGTPKEHSSNTESTQRVHRDDTLEIHHIRIHKNDWNTIQQYFEGKGIKASQGIRMIIKDYMKCEGIY